MNQSASPFSKLGRFAPKGRNRFELWVGSRKCLFGADGTCRGPVRALDLDFAPESDPTTDLPLVPVCEHHRQHLSKGWNVILRNAGLSFSDVANAADLLRSRWISRRSSGGDAVPDTGRPCA